MSQVKQFADITGLHKVFKTYNGSGGTVEGYLPNLLDVLPVKDNGDTFDSDSILFILADSTDEGRYVFTGIKAVEDGTKLTYGGNDTRSYVHERDTFIWALGALIAGSDCGFEEFKSGVEDSWISTNVTKSDSGTVTILVTHKLTTAGIAGKHESGDLDAATSGATVPVITSITLDSTGHVIGVETGKATDTTYRLLQYSETNRAGVTTTYEDLLQLLPVVDGVTLEALSPVTVDEVEHLRYANTAGLRISVGVVNANSSAENVIMTAAAVLAAITAKLEEGVSFRGVTDLESVLNLTSSANGEMWKLNSINIEFPQYKDRLLPALTDASTLSLKIGDVLVAVSKVSNGIPKWYVIPSGDDVEDTWRAIKIDDEDFLTNLIAKPSTNAHANDGMAINLKSGNMITITVDENLANGDVTFNHNLPWTSKPTTAAEAGKYISGITIDNYGHITGITTASISESIKDNIKLVDFQVTPSLTTDAPVEVGIVSKKNDGTSTAGTSLTLLGSDGIAITTDTAGGVLIAGTTNSLASAATVEDEEVEDASKVTVTTTLNSTYQLVTSSSNSKVSFQSNDPTIEVSAGDSTVNIDYTGASSSKDWAVLGTDTIAKKFGKIIGIHKIFNTTSSIENSVFDGDSVDAELNEDSVIYFIADSTDIAKTEFSSLRLKSGWGYIWVKGKLNNADLINMSLLYDDLIKTILPTDSIFPSGFLRDKNWLELPEDSYKSALSSSGTYIVQLTYKQVIYSGILPYKEIDYQENRDSSTDELISIIEVNTDEEIPLTACGYITSDERLYLKVSKGARAIENGKSKPALFIASSIGSGLIPSKFELKFKKLL